MEWQSDWWENEKVPPTASLWCRNCFHILGGDRTELSSSYNALQWVLAGWLTGTHGWQWLTMAYRDSHSQKWRYCNVEIWRCWYALLYSISIFRKLCCVFLWHQDNFSMLQYEHTMNLWPCEEFRHIPTSLLRRSGTPGLRWKYKISFSQLKISF